MRVADGEGHRSTAASVIRIATPAVQSRFRPNQSSNSSLGRAPSSCSAVRSASGTVSVTGGIARRRHDATGRPRASLRAVLRRSRRRRRRTDRLMPAPAGLASRGGVIIVVTSTTTSRAPYSSSSSTPWRQPDAGEDQADLAARDHAEADQQAVAAGAGGAVRRHDLAGDGDHQVSTAAIEQHARLEHRADVGVDADQHEEHRDQHAADRCRGRWRCARAGRCGRSPARP